MKSNKKFFIGLFAIAILFMGFQCASTEITSAKLYIQQKNYDKAIEVLKKEVQKNPKSDQGYYLMGVVYYEKGEYENMLDSFEKSLAISKVYEKEIRDAKKSAWINVFNRGVSLFQRAIKTENADSANVLFDRSIADFNSATKIEPDSADAYKNLAFVFLSKGDNESAIRPLQKLIDLEKAKDGYKYLGEVYFVMGTNLKNEGKEKEAKEYFNKSIEVLSEGRKLYPGDAEILLYLSNAYMGAERISEAMEQFKAGVESQPDNKYYRYNYGVLLLGAERFEEAEAQFKKAIELDPEYSNAIYNLGVTYLKWGGYLNKKAEEEGKFSEEYKEKYRAALPYLEKAVQSPDADANSWELLGRVYSVLGMTDQATKAFEQADKMRK
ncbi:MAG: tetratricopeptide repeat protein [Ignavibacterium sp.]|nr:tetratricopeptide repeat protein [Ignavibacterium sp.]MDW8374421.1 tetratricopeptide repeat protein [Ignavibacteriales bacterium]